MKKQLFFLLVVFVYSSLVLVGCNDDDGPTSIDPDRIARFLNGETNIDIPENSTDIIEIPVFVNHDHDAPVTINFEIEGNTSAYEMISEYGEVVVPAGERQGFILLKAVDNDDINTPDNSVIIRITGADSDFSPPSGVSIGHAEKIITFVDDECPFLFSKTYSAEVSASNQDGPSYTATLTPVDGTDNQFTIDSSWGPNFVAWATGNSAHEGNFLYSSTLTINSDNTITIVGNDDWATGGSGTFTPVPAAIFEFTLTQGLFQNAFTVDVVLTGNCDE